MNGEIGITSSHIMNKKMYIIGTILLIVLTNLLSIDIAHGIGYDLNSLSSGSSLSIEATLRASSYIPSHEHSVSRLVSSAICRINSSFFCDSSDL